MPRVIEIACARDVPVCATVTVGGDVTIWDLETLKSITSLRCPYSFGGRRLALSRNAEFVFAAEYSTGRVSCHHIASGNQTWEARVPKVQYIQPARFGDFLYVSDVRERMFQLAIATGEAIPCPVRANFVAECEDSQCTIFIKCSGKVVAIEDEGRKRFQKNFDDALGWAVTGEGVVGIAGLKETVFLDLERGAEVQRFDHATGGFAGLYYSPRFREFFAIQRGEKGREWALVHLNLKTAHVTEIAKLGNPETDAFSPATNELITANGDIWQLQKGQKRGQLPLDE